MNRSARSFLRPLIMKRNMPSYSSSISGGDVEITAMYPAGHWERPPVIFSRSRRWKTRMGHTLSRVCKDRERRRISWSCRNVHRNRRSWTVSWKPTVNFNGCLVLISRKINSASILFLFWHTTPRSHGVSYIVYPATRGYKTTANIVTWSWVLMPCDHWMNVLRAKASHS